MFETLMYVGICAGLVLTVWKAIVVIYRMVTS